VELAWGARGSQRSYDNVMQDYPKANTEPNCLNVEQVSFWLHDQQWPISLCLALAVMM